MEILQFFLLLDQGGQQTLETLETLKNFGFSLPLKNTLENPGITAHP